MHRAWGPIVGCALLAGCAQAPTAPSGPVAFTGEHLVPFDVPIDAMVRVAVSSLDDVTTFDACVLRDGTVPAWQADHGQGLRCDVEVSGFTHDLRLPAGRYVLALACRPDYATTCRATLEVTVGTGSQG